MSKIEESDYTEDAVIMASQMFLAIVIYPHARDSIELFSRQAGIEHGLDGRFRCYMQFKRPFLWGACHVLFHKTGLKPLF